MGPTQIQVFISSTFADFVAEREHLARTLPKALRERLSPRSVEVSLIDLRWGITEDQLQECSVVRACLGAVERSMPYFVGIIGDRYGTVPEIQAEDIDAYPWLKEMKGKSITELEVLHGVVNSENAKAIFIDTSTSGELVDPRVQTLRSLIASTGAPVLHHPPDVDTMLAFIVDRLAGVLEQTLPEGEPPLAALLAQHPLPFFGRSDLLRDLAGLIDNKEPVIWIHGLSGAGKSALLRHAHTHKGETVAVSTFPDAVDLQMFHDTLASTWKSLVPQDALAALSPMDAREFCARLNKLATAAAKDILLVWDNAPSEWFTLHADTLLKLPKNVRTVVTARERPPPNAVVRSLPVALPDRDDIHAFVTGRLARVGRKLPEDVAGKFVAGRAMQDYHFASIALDELVFASSHVRLADDANRLTQSGGLGPLIEQVVEALDKHLGHNRATTALSAALYYEEPMPEKLLQALLNVDDLRYASLRIALSGAFADHPAGLTLRSSYSRALATSLRMKAKAETEARHDLAVQLLQLAPPRRMDAARQYFRSGNIDRVVALFEQAAIDNSQDVDIVRAAPWLRWAKSRGAPIEEAFSRVLDAIKEGDGAALPRIMSLAVLCDLVLPGSSMAADLHVLVGQIGGPRMEAGSAGRLANTALARCDWSMATGFAIEALVAAVRDGQNDIIAGILSTLAAATASADRPRIAECWLNAALEVLSQMNDRDPAIEAALQSNFGQVFKETGRIDKAVVAAQRAVELRRSSGDYERLPLGLSNLGSVQLAAGKVEEAFASLSEAWELATRLKLPNRGNIAISLVVAEGSRRNRRKRINVLFDSLARSLRQDSGIQVQDVIDFHMTGAERFAEQGERKRALQELDKAEALLLHERSGIWREIEVRRRFIADKRNWTWTGRFRGWPANEPPKEVPERLWSIFDTEEYARFLMRGSLLTVASDKGKAIIVISKSIDDLYKSPIDGIDWVALKAGVGPPPSEHDYIVVYSEGGRFLAFWMPVVPINPVFMGAFNAVIAASVPALADVPNGEVQTEGDEWTKVLRRLVEARKKADALRPSAKQVEGRGNLANNVCSYFPRLKTFAIAERLTRDGLVFSWLSNVVSAQSMTYPAVLWVETAVSRPVMYSESGDGLGAPVLAVALEVSAGVQRFGTPFFGLFTPDGHRTLGKGSIEEFRTRSWETALAFLRSAN